MKGNPASSLSCAGAIRALNTLGFERRIAA